MPAGRIVLSPEQHEPAVLPTTDLAEVNCLGEQTQLGEQLPDIPDKGSPQAMETLIGARGFEARTASRSSNPAGQVYASWATRELLAGSPIGFADRGLRELKGLSEGRRVYLAEGPAERPPRPWGPRQPDPFVKLLAKMRPATARRRRADHKRRCLTPGLAHQYRTDTPAGRSEEHTSELQSRQYLVCRLLLEKKKKPRPTRLQLTKHIIQTPT